MNAAAKPNLTDRQLYPHWAKETLRYCDTDAQGHINNIAFAVFCETGRVHFLHRPNRPLTPPGTFMVIARLALDFLGEIHWPGEAEIGSGVITLGRSSITLGQGVFIGERCVAVAESVLVLADEQSRKSTALPQDYRDYLEARKLIVPV